MDEKEQLKTEKRMKDEAWLEKIKERLDEYAEPVPPSGWERLERELPRRKTIPLRRWMAAIAALLVGALSFIGIRLADDHVPNVPVQPSLHAQAPAPATTADALPSYACPHRQLPPATQASLVQSHTEDSTETTLETILLPDIEPQPQPQKEVKKATELPPTNRELLAMDRQSRPHAKGWAVGILVGNFGGSIGNLSQRGGLSQTQQSAPGTGYSNLDLTATSNGVLAIPKEQEILFQNGLPFLQNRTPGIVSIEHKQPISAGFSIRKNLPKGFSVETGLVYTFLASDILYEGAVQETSQKLHYLGIPLRANWNFVDKDKFTFYVSAGGTVEKCVYGKRGSEDLSIDPVQLSVLAAIGAQYNIGKHFGIYLEPGISYFFDDGSGIRTIRTDNPCNFTLQAGLRLSY